MSPHLGRLVPAALLASVIAVSARGNPPGPPAKKAGTEPAGDALPAGAVARLGTVRWRNGAGLFAVAFSPDGKTLAAAGGSPWAKQGVQSADPTIRLWDVATGRERRQLTGHQGVVTALAFSPDGTTLAATTPEDNGVRLWDLAGGESRKIEFPRNMGPLSAFALSPDGKTLALAGGEQPLVQLREVSGGKQLSDFGEQQAAVESLAYSPDGKSLAAKSGGVVRLWDVATGKLVRKFRPRTYYAKQRRLGLEAGGFGGMSAPAATAPVLFTPDGKTLIAEGGDNTLHVWDAATGKELRQLMHRGPVVSAAVSPDGRRLASGCMDNAVRVWDLATGKEVLHLEGHFGGYMGVAFSPDGKRIASAGGDHTVHLWDAVTGKEVNFTAGHLGEVVGGAFIDGGKVLVTAGRDNTVRFWDVAAGKELRHFANRYDLIDHVAVAPDGKTVVTSGEDEDAVHLWDAGTGKHLDEVTAKPFGFKFTPDGRHLAFLDAEGFVHLRPVGGGTGRRLGDRLQPLTVPVFAFAPDGKTAAVAQPDDSVRLLDLPGGKERGRIDTAAANEGTYQVLFAPDGKTLASLHGNSSVRLWDVGSGRLLYRLQPTGQTEAPNLTLTLAFAPDGRSFATTGGGDRSVHLWEVATGTERRQFAGHRGPTSFVAFSPDGRLLASGGWDTTALLWDVFGLRDQPTVGAGLTDKSLDDLWSDLADADAAKAYRALCRLARSPEQGVSLLQRHLRPASPAEGPRLARLIADLDNDQFAVREEATRELEKLGTLAEAELRKALANRPSPEMRRRVEHVLARTQGAAPTADRLRTGRALEMLELVGSPEARRLLETLAGGPARSTLSQDARAALDRLAKRSPRKQE